jgi:hypothetical protein
MFRSLAPIATLFLLGFSLVTVRARDGASASTVAESPPKSRFQIYLLMGQSNMAGRGTLAPEDREANERVLMFTKQGNWEPAREPVTEDKPGMLGVGPGLAFGKTMLEAQKGVVIGLVPCAVGGTPLRRWQKGGDLYSNAVERARSAMKHGTLAGVLWHQGESEAGSLTNASTYGTRLAGMIQSLRDDLGTPNLPVVAGQLGEFLYDRGQGKSPYARKVNEELARLPQQVPRTACVSSSGLKHKGDNLHFDAESQRELGHRYAAAMLRLIGAEGASSKAEK